MENYYLVLGVKRDATREQIKSAYRRRAKELHPDCCPGSSQPFIEVQQAYEVLSDPERRRAYDDRASPVPSPMRPVQSTRPKQEWGWDRPAEPLIPSDAGDRGRTSSFFARHSLDRQPWPFPGGLDWSQEEGLEVIPIDVTLTPEQAWRGGQIGLVLPVRVECPECGGGGIASWWTCRRCSGSGALVREQQVTISFPGGLANGSIRTVSLAGIGLQVSLRIAFHVS